MMLTLTLKFYAWAQSDRGEKIFATILGVLVIAFMAWRML